MDGATTHLKGVRLGQAHKFPPQCSHVKIFASWESVLNTMKQVRRVYRSGHTAQTPTFPAGPLSLSRFAGTCFSQVHFCVKVEYPACCVHGDFWEASRSLLGASGSLWEPSGTFWEPLGASGSLRELLGSLLGASGGLLGAFWEPLGASGSLRELLKAFWESGSF